MSDKTIQQPLFARIAEAWTEYRGCVFWPTDAQKMLAMAQELIHQNSRNHEQAVSSNDHTE